ncbi:MAG: TonB-dependent receptor [Marinilabiliaceae bacterium]|nr:TonB-dependent receptor [Marinilabiliaceae bacterium]
MRKHFLLFLLGIFFIWVVQAQTNQISGVVTSAEDGEPLIGVNVMIKGTNYGTITDMNGAFKINATPEDAMVFSFLGFITKEVSVENNLDFKVELNEDFKALSEVVVIGYGVQKKSVVTAAISRATSDDLNKETPTRIENVLKGKVSGVQIVQSSGQPNADSKVRVRGVGTINNSDPLYIIDGMPVVGGLNYLNPADIESVEVLKDAASAAIYGTRGANGVILITTKSGKEGKSTINYDVSYGWQNPWKKKTLLNAREYMILMNEQDVNDNGSPRYTPDMVAGAKTTDWQDEVFNYNAPIISHQVSVTGGNAKNNYFLSFGYFKQDGIVGGNFGKSNYERYSLRFNNIYTIYEESNRNFLNKLQVGTNIGYSRSESTAIDDNSEWGSILGSALAFDPTIPVYVPENEVDAVLRRQPLAVTDKDGKVFSLPPAGFQEIANPVAMLHQNNSDIFNDDKFVSSFWGEISILPQLKFRSSYSVDLAFWGNNGYVHPYFLAPQGKSIDEGKGEVWSSMNRGYAWQTENYFSYDKLFGVHAINFVLGQSAFKYTLRHLYGSAINLPSDDPIKGHLDSAIGEETQHRVSGNIGDANFNALASYFTRLSYNYDERYMVQATFRRDGSSRFGANNKWANFPAISIGWNLMNEAFMSDMGIEWLDVVKIRASWGRNGNENIKDLRYTALMDGKQNYYFGGTYILGDTNPGGTGTMYNGTSPAALPNPDLKWEESDQINIGLDLRMFAGALHFDFDYYIKNTVGMLLLSPTIPDYVGQGAPWANVGGEMKNYGMEFELGWKGRVDGFKYWISGNASYIKNKLVNLGTESGFLTIENAGAAGVGEFIRASSGEVFPYFYGLKTDGVFQSLDEVNSYTYTDANGNPQLLQPLAQPGDVRFVSLKNDGPIGDADRTKIGKAMPDWVFGFTLGADFKGFDLNVFLQGTQGNDMFDFNQRADIPSMNRPQWMLQRWHGEGTSDRIPRMTSSDPNGNWKSSDLYIKDGSYIRLKSVQLGYTIPVRLTKIVSVERCRFFVAGENLLTFTKFDGFDPEAATTNEYNRMGVDRGIYPQARTVSIGANISF